MATTTYSSSCPGCLNTATQAATHNTPRLLQSNKVPWSTLFGCCRCGQTWFVCFHIDCTIPSHKNKFLKQQHLKNHVRRWHGPPSLSIAGSAIPAEIMPGNPSFHEDLNVDCLDDYSDCEHTLAVDTDANTLTIPSDQQYTFATTGTARFAHCCVVTTVVQATNCLVQQALLQAPVSLYLDSSANLSPLPSNYSCISPSCC